MDPRTDGDDPVVLPDVRRGALGTLLERRRSTRAFAPGAALPLGLLSDLLWAGHGRRSDGGSVVPSAHRLDPLSLLVVAGDVQGLPAGVHRYRPAEHDLVLTRAGDHRAALAGATLADERWLGTAPAVVVITGDLETARTHFADQPPCGERGTRYVWLDAGT